MMSTAACKTTDKGYKKLTEGNKEEEQEQQHSRSVITCAFYARPQRPAVGGEGPASEAGASLGTLNR